MTEATTHTIDVPGAVLTYDIRPCSDADSIPLVMVASPIRPEQGTEPPTAHGAIRAWCR